MFGPSQVLWIFVLPAALAGVLFLVAAARAPEGLRIAALGAGLGLLAGYWGLFRRLPPLPPHDSTHCLLYALLGTTLAAAFERPRHGGLGRLAVRALVAVLAPALYLKNLIGRWEAREVALHVGALTLAILVSWYGLDALARRWRGASLPLVLWLAAAAASGGLLLAGFAVNAQWAGALAAIWAAAAVASRISAKFSLEGGAVGVASVALVSFSAGGVYLASLPRAAGMALALAPLAAWLAELGGRSAPRRAALVRMALVALPLAYALWLAWQHRPAQSSYP
jgi:hypothetical protein